MSINMMPPPAISGEKEDGGFAYASIDVISHALEAISHEHHQIHEGATFRYFDSVTLGSAATQDYLITTPNTSAWAHFGFIVDGTAVTSAAFYEATDKVGTALQAPRNANRNSAVASTTTVHKGISGGTTDGIILVQYSSGTATNQSRSGASLDHVGEWVLKQNTKYLVRITSGTAGNLCNVTLDWYEHNSLT